MLSVKLSFEAIIANIVNVEAVWLSTSLTLSTSETEQLLDRLPNLEWVYSQRNGIDHLAMNCYKNRGIKVSTSGKLVSSWVAQMNIACILSHAKNIPAHIHQQRHHQNHAIYCQDITEQTVAIVGTGNIGNETARLCNALGMRVVGLSRQPLRGGFSDDYDAIYDIRGEFSRALKEADYLVLALPLSQGTKNFVGTEILGLMKASACVVNLSRPQLVNERALLAALKSGSLSAAYVSGLQNVSRLDMMWAARRPNLVITHYSDAHLLKKNVCAFNQFIHNLAKLRDDGDVEDRIL